VSEKVSDLDFNEIPISFSLAHCHSILTVPSLANAEKKLAFCSCNVIHDVFVLFASVKVEVISFDTFVSDRSLALGLLHVRVLDQSFGLRLKTRDFELSER